MDIYNISVGSNTRYIDRYIWYLIIDLCALLNKANWSHWHECRVSHFVSDEKWAIGTNGCGLRTNFVV